MADKKCVFCGGLHDVWKYDLHYDTSKAVKIDCLGNILNTVINQTSIKP